MIMTIFLQNLAVKIRTNVLLPDIMLRTGSNDSSEINELKKLRYCATNIYLFQYLYLFSHKIRYRNII